MARELVDQPEEPDVLAAIDAGVVVFDEAAARRTLRGQITRLEQQLAQDLVTRFDRRMAAPAVPARRRSSSPRLMSLGELEEHRDDLITRLRAGRRDIDDQDAVQARNRVTLEKMRCNPRAYKGQRLRRIDVGEPGCGTYEVKPRLGLIGMLCGWWHVTVSSGCPLATSQR